MNKSEPLVSICIPCFNSSLTIERTIKSLLNQSYANIVIKVFDNASTDDTVKVVHEIKNKFDTKNIIKIFTAEVNVGGEGNFNRCIDGMEGVFGAIFHADDTYEIDCIATHIKYLTDNADCVCTVSNAYTIDENDVRTGVRFLPKELRCNEFNKLSFKEFFSLVLKYANFVTCPSAVGRVDVFKNKIKPWNGTTFKTSADLDVWLKFSLCGKLGIISRPLMNYRESTSSYSFNIAKVRTFRHHFFLVAGNYVENYQKYSATESQKEICDNDKQNLKFLLIKDDAQIVFNIMKNNLQGEEEKSKIKSSAGIYDLLSVWRVFFHSSWHRKFYILSFVILLLKNLYTLSVVRQLINFFFVNIISKANKDSRP